MQKPSLLIGLTGSIGAGKSTAARIIAEQFPVLSSDRIARDIMEQDDGVRSLLIDVFGVQVFLSNGDLDTRFLAEIVFHDDAKLRMLNDIVHPPAIKSILGEAAALHDEGHHIVFVESALIYETDIEHLFDYVVAIISGSEETISRIMQRDKVDEKEVRRRMRHQLPPEEKADRADFTVRNNGTLDDLRRSVTALLSVLAKLSPRRET
ncbi:MAG: dephospho-CoA kinase [Bacteroidetes bacterium]|nr:dephospho-CoA kinase [Bacteroidota bacterium]